ncbi:MULTISPECIES: cytochrome c maturation protein CcmE [unclassified Modicisalibacter]|uniref:cytochrome c maturation protein CcmE n=1 Tax=unclassified Modicisalibacter TaxID=2679913 RepID=UPI001CC9FBD6|nr:MULTISPECIES: cytochrome c maturation protein CcmE [unclassified Modicisalibacter]MBZ9559443.1 cytochrome c maturation protein CcmE [Modicisalibacter sp. R2A 31.J]MBZ9576391.1 cytochrome c maturation protein CcmE [Modicisalibacter sp. MOD 31.J]
MTPKRRQRLLALLSLVVLAALAVGLTGYALRSNINLFFTPSQIADGEAPVGRQIRAGGMVEKGSVVRDADSLDVRFTVTDFDSTLEITYSGILPDLFREGQGVVVVGKLADDGVLHADQVLAKHDEKYMPPEVADALEAAGKLPAGDGSGQ